MDTLLPILGTVLLASITPGPSMLLAMDHGLRFGVPGAIPTALGNVVATAIQATLSLSCLWFALRRAGDLVPVVAWAGAIYLGFLGARMMGGRIALRGGPRPGAADAGGARRFRRALLVTLANPAAYVFFTAVFPTLVGQRAGTVKLLTCLVLPTLAITFACMMLYAAFGRELSRFLQGPRRARAFRLTLGATFIGLGLWLALGL